MADGPTGNLAAAEGRPSDSPGSVGPLEMERERRSSWSLSEKLRSQKDLDEDLPGSASLRWEKQGKGGSFSHTCPNTRL